MPNDFVPFLFNNDVSDGMVNNQDFIDILFFWLAATSLINYADDKNNPDIRNDKSLEIILDRLDKIEKQQRQIIDILEKK